MRITVALLGLCFSLCAQNGKEAKQSLEPWQQSWDIFVKEYRACRNCPRFAGKDVVWEGTVKSVDLAQSSGNIGLNMGVPPGTYAAFGFSLTPTAGQRDKWKDVKVGQRVRFRTRTDGGLTNNVVSTINPNGQVLAIFKSEGAELLSVLDDKK